MLVEFCLVLSKPLARKFRTVMNVIVGPWWCRINCVASLASNLVLAAASIGEILPGIVMNPKGCVCRAMVVQKNVACLAY